jgi:hypothetical protein
MLHLQSQLHLPASQCLWSRGYIGGGLFGESKTALTQETLGFPNPSSSKTDSRKMGFLIGLYPAKIILQHKFAE